MQRYILIVVFIFAVSIALGHAKKTVGTPTPQYPKVCETEIGAKVGAVTFEKAQRFFLNRRLTLSTAKEVKRPSDMEGAIMVYGRIGKWLYVTKAELWYDPDREVAAYARLEGILHNGQTVNIDISKEIPEGFHPVKNWSEVGAVILKDIDGKIRRTKNLAFEVKNDGSLYQKKSNSAAQNAGGVLVPNEFEGGACGARATVSCNGIFCLGSCSKTIQGEGEGCHCNYYVGVCMTSPGLACGGACPNIGICAIGFANPGLVTCGCLGSGGGGGGGFCDPYFDPSCECMDDFGFPDPFCIEVILNGVTKPPTLKK